MGGKANEETIPASNATAERPVLACVMWEAGASRAMGVDAVELP